MLFQPLEVSISSCENFSCISDIMATFIFYFLSMSTTLFTVTLAKVKDLMLTMSNNIFVRLWF